MTRPRSIPRAVLSVLRSLLLALRWLHRVPMVMLVTLAALAGGPRLIPAAGASVPACGAPDTCPGDGILLQFSEGRLRPREVAELQGHLDRCPGCLGVVLTLTRQSAPPADLDPDGGCPPRSFDEYRLLLPLGRGAMGQVYLAHDRSLDRLVAIKFMSGAGTGASRERLRCEARLAARLAHPNIVAVHRLGEVAGRPYLVSEFISGPCLADLPLPLPCPQVAHIAVGLARALSAAHGRGVLHRDIKPANVMLTPFGEVKLLDFGLARPFGAVAARAEDEAPPSTSDPALADTLRAPASPLTRTGTLAGTPLYMAPELWQGAPASVASDIYALGALLYELCAGRPPHRAPTLPALAHAIQSGPPPSLRHLARPVAAPLARAVERCLSRDPAERYASADDLLAALLPSTVSPAWRPRALFV